MRYAVQTVRYVRSRSRAVGRVRVEETIHETNDLQDAVEAALAYGQDIRPDDVWIIDRESPKDR